MTNMVKRPYKIFIDHGIIRIIALRHIRMSLKKSSMLLQQPDIRLNNRIHKAVGI